MREIIPETAGAYLRETGRAPLDRKVEAEALGWGVSNVVMRVEVEGEPPFVLKQSRGRLRTAMEWVSRIDRIWTEVAALELLGEVMDPGLVPRVLFVDRDNYAFAMSLAPEGSRVWKEMLLEGDLDPDLASRAGAALGAIHARLAGHPAFDSGPLADLEVFDQLRVDPFYRTLARAHPDLAPAFNSLITSMPSAPDRTFVHADFSPKNILVSPDPGRSLTLVDFETAHAGDPAFDLGFFLSHLLLKAVRSGTPDDRGMGLVRAAWSGYLAARGPISPDLSARAALHLAACALARVDGKSPVDYLSDAAKGWVRAQAREQLGRGEGRPPILPQFAP